MSQRKRSKTWSWQTGDRGCRITVYEKTPDGVLYARTWDTVRKKYIKRSLGHRDRERAQVYARAEVNRLREGQSSDLTRPLKLSMLLSKYLVHRSPRKTPGEATQDRRRAEMYTRIFGGDTLVEHLEQWETWRDFVDDRRAGVIDGRGVAVADGARRTMAEWTLHQDLVWLVGVFNWGHKYKVEGVRLLPALPFTRGELRQELGDRWPDGKASANRPVMTNDRYERMLAVAPQVRMQTCGGGFRVSYLHEMLVLSWESARRIGALRGLRWSDIEPEARDTRGHRLPHGVITWRGERDKKKKTKKSPITAAAKKVLDAIRRDRPGLGNTFLFPSPSNPNQPIDKTTAYRWFIHAEKLAGLPHLKQGAWHMERRSFATRRKHRPAKEVAEAGGWADTKIVEDLYTEITLSDQLEVLEDARELREQQA